MKNCCRFLSPLGILLFLSIQVYTLTSIEAAEQLPKLKVHANNRFLVTEAGKPFFWLGDTAWELFHRLNREEAIHYLDNRQKLGFTVIQAVALAELDGLTKPNAYGFLPFTDEKNAILALQEGPENDYWDHVDFIVNEANKRGMYLGFLPTWGRYWTKGQLFNPNNAATYAETLGKRYKDKGIIWILGGDRVIETEDERNTLIAMAQGLKRGDQGSHLITFHPRGGGGSSNYFHGEPWLDFNMRQNGHGPEYHTYANTKIDYDRRPMKPILDGEPLYEDHPINFNPDKQGHSVAADVRRPFYWNIFDGAFGHTYGHHSVWQMYDPLDPQKGEVNRPLMAWHQAIDQPGAAQMQYGRKLMESRPFLERIPDMSIIVEDRIKSAIPGTGVYRFAATRDIEGTYAFIYVPCGRTFSVRMDAIKGKNVRAWWYNPRNGEATPIGVYPSEGVRQFVSPTPGELLDWILVLDDAESVSASVSVEQPSHKILLELGVEQIVYVKRQTFQSTHYYTDFIDGALLYGCDLCLFDLKSGTTNSLLPPELKGGIISRCNLSFDAKKIIFDYKSTLDEGFRIWEIGIDGTGLQQLTFPPEDEQARIAKYRHPWHKTYRHQTDDMHPCYLPDGGFMFISSRCELGILCDGADILTTTVLYRADSDGKNIEKLSNNALSEATPCVMEDGRVLYTRWEYVDNGSVSNKGLWTVRPDGTGSEELYGTNIACPPVHYAGRPVPGSNHLFVCVGTPHMPLAVGPIILIDSRKDRTTGEPMTYMTPEVEVRHQWGWDNYPNDTIKPIQAPLPDYSLFHTDLQWDGKGNTDKGPLYADPFPLNEELCIVSFNPDLAWNSPCAYSLYLIDAKGARLPITAEKEASCWSALPVVARPCPPVVCGTIDEKLAKENLAHLMVTNVYQGLEGVPPGTAKYLRINEHVPRPWSARRFWTDTAQRIPDQFDQQHSVISMKTHLGLKVQHGIVPVEEDGSANFYVRADRNIFLQLLDKDYREIQRERTFTDLRPGEVRTCIGCHENAASAAEARPRFYPLALQRDPNMPGPQPGEISGARPLHYPTDVQPILDRYCISCHCEGNASGNIVLTGEMTELFSRSYEEILKRKLFPVIGENHPKMGNNHQLPPYTLGAHSGTFIKRITTPQSPCFAAIPLEEMIRLTTWVDSNAQYYGSYFGKKSLRYKDEPDFRPTPTFEETQGN